LNLKWLSKPLCITPSIRNCQVHVNHTFDTIGVARHGRSAFTSLTRYVLVNDAPEAALIGDAKIAGYLKRQRSNYCFIHLLGVAKISLSERLRHEYREHMRCADGHFL